MWPPSLSDLVARGAQLLSAGDLDGAHAAYAQAVALRPELPDAWFNLAWIERTVRRFDEALHSYGEAIRYGVDRAEEAHLNRAVILSEHQFRPGAALQEIDVALAINPCFVPALLNRGMICEDLGDAQAARATYRQALALESVSGRAHARLAALDLLDGQADRAVRRLSEVIDLALTLDDRVELLFALGDALDRLARYDEAFRTYETANGIARWLDRVGYDPVAQAELVDRLVAAFPSPIVRADDRPGTEPELLFICGMFRSGSTLAERILGQHSAVTTAGELEFFPALARSLHPYPESVRELAPQQVETLRQTYLSGLPAGRVVTDKRCDNFMHIGLIKTLFPRARIVHTVRDPLDTFLSIYFLNFGEAVTYGHDLSQIAHYYIQYRRMMEHWSRLFPDDIHEFSYDEMVLNPREAVPALLDFLGLPFDEACLTPEQGRGAVRTASAWQVRQPVHARSSGRWRHYERHLTTPRELLDAAGYQLP